MSSVLDLLRAAFAACPMSDHPDAELTGDAIKMAATVRGGKNAIDGVIFHAAVDQPTLQAISPHYVGDLGSDNRWDVSGRVSTTPPARPSSPWSTSSSRGATLPPRPRLVPSSRHGARISTTLSATALPGCCRQSSTKRSRHPVGGSIKNASTISGEAHFLISKLMASVGPLLMRPGPLFAVGI